MLIALSRRAFVRVPATRCLATLTQHCSISNAVPFVSIMSRLQPTRLGQSHHMSSASKSVMFSTSSRPPLAELSSARVHLTHRSIISVSGSDTVKFLQNLVTADVRTLESARCLYTTFLNSKGRFLADAFLYAGQPLASGDSAVLIDCASAHVKALLAHLNMFRIRARVNVVDVSSSHSVYALLQADTSQADLMAIGAALCPAGSIVVADPRTSNLGVRVVTSAGAPLKDHTIPAISTEEYHIIRTALGVFDGSLDATTGESIALECNLAWLHGVSFEKGCYLGQELMARTHFKGLVRKRLVPVCLTSATELDQFNVPAVRSSRILPYSFIDPSVASIAAAPVFIENESKPVGQMFGSHGNIALAMLRMEHLSANKPLVIQTPNGENIKIRPYVPAYWPPLAEVFKADE